MGDDTISSGGAVTRRNALKIGAAAGVGAAAWTGPKLGVFGASPAYAGMCSPGEAACSTRSGSPSGSNNAGTGADASSDVCSNGGNQASRVYRLGSSNTPPSMPSMTIDGVSRTVTQGGGNCSNGGATLTVGGSGSLTCRVALTIGNVTKTAVGGNTVTIPSITRGEVSGEPRFASFTLTICCSSDLDPGDCDLLPPDGGDGV